jgi:hypothetical protein
MYKKKQKNSKRWNKYFEEAEKPCECIFCKCMRLFWNGRRERTARNFLILQTMAGTIGYASNGFQTMIEGAIFNRDGIQPTRTRLSPNLPADKLIITGYSFIHVLQW